MIKVPYALAVHGQEELEAVSKVIKERRTIMGQEVQNFEKQVASLFDKKHGIMVNSGSSANLLAAFALINPLKKNKLNIGFEANHVSFSNYNSLKEQLTDQVNQTINTYPPISNNNSCRPHF